MCGYVVVNRQKNPASLLEQPGLENVFFLISMCPRPFWNPAGFSTTQCVHWMQSRHQPCSRVHRPDTSKSINSHLGHGDSMALRWKSWGHLGRPVANSKRTMEEYSTPQMVENSSSKSCCGCFSSVFFSRYHVYIYIYAFQAKSVRF